MLEYPDAGRQSTGTAVHDRYYNLRGVCTNLVLRVEVEHMLSVVLPVHVFKHVIVLN